MHVFSRETEASLKIMGFSPSALALPLLLINFHLVFREKKLELPGIFTSALVLDLQTLKQSNVFDFTRILVSFAIF